MGKFGPVEMLIALVIVLVLFGAKRVPEIGASIGKGIREFKRGMNDIDRQMDEPASTTRIASAPPAAATHAEDEAARPEPRRLL